MARRTVLSFSNPQSPFFAVQPGRWGDARPTRSRTLSALFCALLLLVSTVVEADVADDLVAYWSFDEGMGDTAGDTAGDTNDDGTLVGGPAWTEGIHGTALEFDGDNDRVEVPISTDLEVSNGLSISAWVWVDPAAGGIDYILSTLYGNGYFLRWDMRPGFGPEIDFGARGVIDAEVAPAAGVWTHLAGTYDTASAISSIYVNGERVASAQTCWPAPCSPESPARPLTIGSFHGGTDVFRGKIDEVYIHDRELTQDEVQELAEIPCGDLVWHRDACEYCGQDAYNETGIPEMDHKCVLDLIDFAIFIELYRGGTGTDPSGDFGGDGDIDPQDLATFIVEYGEHHGDPIPDCTPACTQPDGCGGTLRISFSAGLEDVDEIQLTPGVDAWAYVVAEGCDGIHGAHAVIRTTPNIVITWPLDVGDRYGGDFPFEGAGGSGPEDVFEIEFHVTDSEPAQLWLENRRDWSPVQWVTTEPPRVNGFETIASAGINAPPGPDRAGCLTSDVAADSRIPPRSCEITTWPNPSRGNSHIRLAISTRTSGIVSIHDVSGRFVRQLHAGGLQAGDREFTWDGRDPAGDRVAAGIYFIRLSTDDGRSHARLLLLE